MSNRDMQKAALRGEPSYVWRAGQQRRLEMIVHSASERIQGNILENGCGVGMYVEHLAPFGGKIFGLEYDFERASEAARNSPRILNAACESLPLPSSTFDLILSHEVIEHVQDDRAAVCEMVRVLKARRTNRFILSESRLSVRNARHLLERQILFWQQAFRELSSAHLARINSHRMCASIQRARSGKIV